MSTKASKKVTLQKIVSRSGFLKANIKVIDDTGGRIGTSMAAVNMMLTYKDEMECLMPTIIGLSPNSPLWDTKIREYFDNMSVMVTEAGKILEVGFMYQDAAEETKHEKARTALYTKYRKEVDANPSTINDVYQKHAESFINLETDKFKKEKDSNRWVNTPINNSDYILWRYCLIYGKVANIQSLVKKSGKIELYIEDLEETKRNNKSIFKTTMEARKLMVEKLGDRDFINNLLFAVSENPKYHEAAYSSDDTDKDMAINLMTDVEPTKFIQLSNDKNLIDKAFIQRCINAGILRRIVNTEVIVDEEDTRVGNTLTEAIFFIKNEKNIAKVSAYKARLKTLVK